MCLTSVTYKLRQSKTAYFMSFILSPRFLHRFKKLRSRHFKIPMKNNDDNNKYCKYSINIEYLISRLSASVLQPVLDLRLVLRTGLFEF